MKRTEHKTNDTMRGTLPEIERAAIELRRRSTPAEALLWAALRGRKLGGLKFRRQHPVGPSVLDFYCADLNLVVEVDGPIHDIDARRTRDDLRTEQLTGYGLTVLRFRNEDVLTDLPAVLRRIRAAAEVIHSSPVTESTPLPDSGEGPGVRARSPGTRPHPNVRRASPNPCRAAAREGVEALQRRLAQSF